MKSRIRSTFVLVVGFAAAAGGCGGNETTNKPPVTAAVTFWNDVAPIYDQKCVRCHQDGGIGPFRLDNYADAKAHAAVELARVAAGTMPPYFLVHDGTCGSFHDDATLTESEKTTIASWVNGERAEGVVPSERAPLPDRPQLAGAVDLATPSFAPVAQGGKLAEFDEYRCFLMDPPTAAEAFLTGYDVSPGEPTIVHHVIGMIIDPEAPGAGGMTNASIMKALDDESPDRAGWPCFGGAGDGVDVSGMPVVWAPGQGIVNYPDGMGVPLRPTDKLVVQVHYNLADATSARKTDTTVVHLKLASHVDRMLAFLLPDAFLDTLGNEVPDSLPPQKVKTSTTWTVAGRDLGISDATGVDLIAVMPHMHGRGLSQNLQIGPPGNLACAANLQNWNFHWQEFYFYKTPPKITPATQIRVTCDYNTLTDTQPVLPGWGTRNEMCLTVLMVALPPS